MKIQTFLDRMIRWSACTLFLPLLMLACGKGRGGSPSFADRVQVLESDPKAALSELSVYRVDTIHEEEDATLFLLYSLAGYYTQEKYIPDTHKLSRAASFFRSKDTSEQLLETLYLLAQIYRDRKDLKSELNTLEEAIKIAQDAGQADWLFYLYNHLSDMYRRKYDILDYAKYRALANRQFERLDQDRLNVETRLLAGENYLLANEPERAILTLRSVDIDERHELYADLKRLIGIYHVKRGEWQEAIEAIEESLRYEKQPGHKFTACAALLDAYTRIGDLTKAAHYRDMALSYEDPEEISYAKTDFYKSCSELARMQGRYEEQMGYMRKVHEQYELIINDLNNETLNEAIQSNERRLERRHHYRQLREYRLYAVFLALGLAGAVILYLNRKRRQALRIISLQERIRQLEYLGWMKDEAKSLIFKDIETEKRILLLRHTQQEKCNKLLGELCNLGILRNAEVSDFQWDKFYQHIDILLDNFHEKLIGRYPLLQEKEIQLCCLMVAGFRTEEIAAVWNQSVFSVHKTRTGVRKKLDMREGGDIVDSLKKELSIPAD